MSTSTSASEKQRVICVFCGSHPGKTPSFLAAARSLAEILHKEKIKLVYGGGTRGIMGELARTLVNLAGPDAVHGVIPKALVEVEEGYQTQQKNANDSADGPETGKLAERIVSGSPSELEAYGRTTTVPDMHTRKGLMAKEVIEGGPGSGFVVLPGGFGTMEEAMEMVTWNQLGIHQRGIVLLNIDGYYDGVLDWVERSVAEGFVSDPNKKILVECKKPEELVAALDAYKPSEGRCSLNWGVQQG